MLKLDMSKLDEMVVRGKAELQKARDAHMRPMNYIHQAVLAGKPLAQAQAEAKKLFP